MRSWGDEPKFRKIKKSEMAEFMAIWIPYRVNLMEKELIIHTSCFTFKIIAKDNRLTYYVHEKE